MIIATPFKMRFNFVVITEDVKRIFSRPFFNLLKKIDNNIYFIV